MNTFNTLPGRALDLATQLGDGIKQRVPDRALKWIETGAALGALKTGGRVAGRFVRRNPVVAVAAVAGAGMLWYLARRRQKQAEQAGNGAGAIQGTSTRIEARRGNGGARGKAAGKHGTRARHTATT